MTIEETHFNNTDFLSMPWTIEHQLEAYAHDPRHTDRHESLYWSWKQLSRWLVNLLDYSIASFPTYSQHNESHCLSILHNIECLLGEDEIRRLSPTDCFGILLTVYLHDLGMIITDEDRNAIVGSDTFYYTIEELERSQDQELKEAARILKETDYRFLETGSPDEIRNHLKRLYGRKLGVYNALGLLLGEHQRRMHAQKSAEWLRDWVKDSSQTQSGFAMTGIPLRIFLQLAECARMHNTASFRTLLTVLLDCDNGFASDKYHPRFIAVMLMLGDILDVDNNRFNPFAKKMAGDTFTIRSEIHYKKHAAIRALQITPKKICIQADCETPDELRLLRSEFDWLEDFLRECNYHWAEIAPDNFCGCLPSLEFRRIRLNGKEIPSDLVTSKFQISQRKAFNLLQGANLYESRFAFLRELFQNATDATKRQYWNDLDATERNSNQTRDLIKANEILSLKGYPIHIDFKVQKRSLDAKRELSDVTIDDLRLTPSELEEKFEFGVLVLVQDCGIGISQEDIRSIIEVGTSHERERENITRMPEWLRPNGHFGIGLQSLFLVGDTFECTTRTRREECYKISFSSGATGDGHIDVIPQDIRDAVTGSIPYGTSFSVFVRESYRESREKNTIGWIGADPYEKDYLVLQGLRNSVELMRQMEHYIDSQIGEWIFPAIIREFPLHESLQNNEDTRRKVTPQTPLELYRAIRQEITIKDVDKAQRVTLLEEDNTWSNWLFGNPPKESIFKEIVQENKGKDAYCIELPKGRIKVWSQKAQCFFCCSPARILCSDKGESGRQGEYNRIRVFVKGLFITEVECPGNELLEYIDIKSDALQNHIQMNRDALTEKGREHLLKEIIPTLLQSFNSVLHFINCVVIEQVASNQQKIIWALENEYYHIINENITPPSESKQQKTTPEFSPEKVKASFKNRLLSLPAENYILWNLLHSGHLLQEVPTSGAQGLSVKDQYDANELFDNDLIAYLKSSDYISFKQGDKNILQYRQRMLDRLYSTAQYLEKDYATIFLTDFIARLDKTLAVIAQVDSNDTETLQAEIRQKAKELQQYVVLYGMLFFYVNRDKIEFGAKCVPESSPSCYWKFVNDKVAKILKYVDSKLSRKLLNSENAKQDSRTKEFFKDNANIYREELYVPGTREDMLGGLRYYSMAEILMNENHFAIFSTRQTSQDTWKHLLVQLCPLRDRFQSQNVFEMEQTVFDVLNQTPVSVSLCIERWAFLDQWSEDIIEKLKRTHILRQGNQSRGAALDLKVWGNQLTWWMIHYYPTIALGADGDGNNRLNVLGRRPNEHIFMDARMVVLLLQRVKEMSRKMSVPRMQTPTWDGFAILNLDYISSNIMTVTRGLLPVANGNQFMLLGIPYLLPENAYLPYDKTAPNPAPTALSNLGIRKLPQLLDHIKASYENLDQGNWGTLGQLAVITQCDIVRQFTPLEIDIDKEQPLINSVQWLYKQITPETHRDLSLLLQAPDTLKETLKGLFGGILEGSQENGAGFLTPWQSWTQLKLPVNQSAYKISFLLKAYQLDLDSIDEVITFGEATGDISEEVSGVLRTHLNEEEFWQTTRKLYRAIQYCGYHAEEEYRSLFLKDVCDWWLEEIWQKDPGREGLLQYSQEHTNIKATDELQQLYMAQVRRIMCAVLSSGKSYLADREKLDDMKRWVNIGPHKESSAHIAPDSRDTASGGVQ